MSKSIFVPLDEDERDLLLRLLDVSGSECHHYIDGNYGTGQDTSAVERELDDIDVLYERIADDVPATRGDVLKMLRIIGNTIVDDPALRREGRSIYRTLKARCANSLRLARQSEASA